jgi:mRNA-degrading endonuclease RelE of RelBE toxin-antitoxin system
VWETDPSNQFKRGYKHASGELQTRIKKAIRDLTQAEDPRTLGKPKHGQLGGLWAYDFGQKCRLLYLPVDETNTILLDRVCDHGVVYGKR